MDGVTRGELGRWTVWEMHVSLSVAIVPEAALVVMALLFWDLHEGAHHDEGQVARSS
jgi:hypothetical protein